MSMTDYTGKRVLVIGAARQGLALTRFLVQRGAFVTLNDQRTAEQMQAAIDALAGLPIQWELGSHPAILADRSDLVCASGGVPLTLAPIQRALQLGIPVSNDSQIFMEEVPCPVIAITGSAGKTTTTTLVGRMAQAGYTNGKVWIGGNIGLPLIDLVDQVQVNDLVVLELSSFQLELMTASPHIGAILNITPNHLDRHGTMEAYAAAKAKMILHQTSRDTAVLGRDDPVAWSFASRVQGRLVSFGFNRPGIAQIGTYLDKDTLSLQTEDRNEPLMSTDVIKLRGEHNIANTLAACAIAYAAGLPLGCMKAGVAEFTGVPHRLQFVRTCNGASWYNDSIATAPERTIAAIHSFTEPLVLLLGGRDKNLPWENLADLVHQRVDHLVIFGEAAEKIATAIGSVQPGRLPLTIDRCASLKEAVAAAASRAESGDVVLFSPGGTSFDEFQDFEQRGERFQEWVQAL